MSIRLLSVSVLVLLTVFPVNAWEYKEQKDEFEGTVNPYIVSDFATPNRPLSWPNSEPIVYLYFDCQDRSWVLRNSANNLQGGDIEDGYNNYKFRAKLDGGEIFEISVFQSWGSEFFLLRTLGRHLGQANNLTIQLNHFGDGPRRYTFDMTTFDRSLCNGG